MQKERKNGWLNESEVTTEFTQIEALRGRLIDSQVELKTLLQSMRPETPKVQNLDTKIEAMKISLTELQSKLLKNESGSSISLANDFSRLSLELEFSQNKYAASTSAFSVSAFSFSVCSLSLSCATSFHSSANNF